MEKLRFALKAGQIVVVERVITVLARPIDAVMLYIIATFPTNGVLIAFLFCAAATFIFSVAVVLMEHHLVMRFEKGVTGVYGGAEVILQEFEDNDGLYTRFLRFICSKPRYIFWIGSWFFLDPDYVTLLLAKRGDTLSQLIWRITLPSTIVSTVVWTPFYWMVVTMSSVLIEYLLRWVFPLSYLLPQ